MSLDERAKFIRDITARGQAYDLSQQELRAIVKALERPHMSIEEKLVCMLVDQLIQHAPD